VKQRRLPRKGNEREDGRKEGKGRKKGTVHATHSLDKSRTQEAAKRSIQFSSVQFSSERTNERTERLLNLGGGGEGSEQWWWRGEV
jgi:hypothetical protein